MNFTHVCLVALLTMGGLKAAEPSAKELSDRGAALLNRSDFKAAESTLRSAAERAAKGESHAALRGSIHNNLGVALYHQGRYPEAELILRSALPDLESGGNAADFANGLYNLSAVYRRMGRVQEAGLLAEDALHILEEVGGPTSKAAGQAWLSLAELYRSMGELGRAERAAARAVTILTSQAQSEAVHADALATRALVLLSLRRIDEAGRLADHALRIRRAVLPPDDLRIATSLALLGNVRLSEYRLDEAAEHFGSAIDAWRRHGIEQHPNMAAWSNNLAQIHKLSGRFNEARTLYRKALMIWEGTVGRQHPEYAMGLANLADLMRAEGKLQSSAKLYREAIAILRVRLHPAAEAVLNAERGLNDVERGAAARRAAYTVDYRDLKKR